MLRDYKVEVDSGGRVPDDADGARRLQNESYREVDSCAERVGVKAD